MLSARDSASRIPHRSGRHPAIGSQSLLDALFCQECRYDGGDCGRTILFLYGEEVSIDKYKEELRTFSIVQSSFSAVSLLVSIAILCIIHRSHDRLSTTINRMLFGLCVSDILSSFNRRLKTVTYIQVYKNHMN